MFKWMTRPGEITSRRAEHIFSAIVPFVEEDDAAKPRTTLTLLMEFPTVARRRDRKGGLVINN